MQQKSSVKIVNIQSVKPELFTIKKQKVQKQKGVGKDVQKWQLCYDSETNFALYSSYFKCPFGVSNYKDGDAWTLSCELNSEEIKILESVDEHLVSLVEKCSDEDIVELRKVLNLTGKSAEVVDRSYSRIVKPNKDDKYKIKINSKVYLNRVNIYVGNSKNKTEMSNDVNSDNYAKKVVPYNSECQGLFRLSFWIGTKGDFGVSVYLNQLRVHESSTQSNKSKGICLIPPYPTEEPTHVLFSVRALF